MMSHHPDRPFKGGVLGWVDERFPSAYDFYRDHMIEYYAPKNFNFWYFFGSLALVVLANQIITGILLTMHYKPDTSLNASGIPNAFASVEYIMRDVPWGWLIRYMHSTGASAFFVVVYLHMFRGMMYGSYRKPRELVWIFGMLIFLLMMAEGFFGYLLPWGQMSFWGAQVIINLFDAIPYIGHDLSTLIRGDFVIGDATLNRFFSFHVIAVPLALVGLVVVHILALHDVGSNNPDGIEIKKTKDANGVPLDGVPFHPYFVIKDAMGTVVFLIVFSIILFFLPEGFGYALEYNNFVPADQFHGPAHIAPVWYFTPYYSVLRATTDDMVNVLSIIVAAATLLTIIKSRLGVFTKLLLIIASAGLICALGGFKPVLVAIGLKALTKGFLGGFDPKLWGVAMMGASVLIYFLMPWLDKSPVKSIRYKGPIYKVALSLFVLSFVILGYLGSLPPTANRTLVSQVCTLIYFAFFLLMPFYSKIDKCKPEPDRVTSK